MKFHRSPLVSPNIGSSSVGLTGRRVSLAVPLPSADSLIPSRIAVFSTQYATQSDTSVPAIKNSAKVSIPIANIDSPPESALCPPRGGQFRELPPPLQGESAKNLGGSAPMVGVRTRNASQWRSIAEFLELDALGLRRVERGAGERPPAAALPALPVRSIPDGNHGDNSFSTGRCS